MTRCCRPGSSSGTGWADDQLDRALYSQVVTDAAAWDSNGRDPAYLYRPGRLATVDAAAARWRAAPARYPKLPATSEAFLGTAHHAARRAVRRRRAMIAGLLALTVIAVSAAGIAVRAAASASRQAASASRQHAIALSRQLAAESLAADPASPFTARRLAVAAWRVFPTDQAGAVLASLLVEQQQEGILPGDPANLGVNAVAFSPDGKLLAAAQANGYVRLWNTATGQPVGAPLLASTSPQSYVAGVAFSPDGKLLATAGDDGTVRLWNPVTGQPVGAPLIASTGPGNYVHGVAFSPDGKLLASADGDGTVRLWNPATGSPSALPSSPDRPRRTGLTGWRSARTASCWPAPATTAPCGCGTRPPGSLSALPSSPAPAGRRERGGVQPGRQAAGRRRRATAPCGCGTRSPGRPSALPSSAGTGPGGERVPGWRSARTASCWPAPTRTAPCGRGKCPRLR